MEYRKKNLKPKQNIDIILQKALNNEEFMHRIDFIGTLRKDIYTYQNENKIKALKACTITNDGLSIFLNQCFKQFVQQYQTKAMNP